ncbi:MAG TPA: hypothetical protein VE782_13050 [Myxococcaceae bacterium]|nr:hypothetical protein [Myxococcaceae bacterium]
MIALALVAFLAQPALAEIGPVCTAPHEVDKYQLLRRLSLDLRGRVPTMEEYAALDGESSVPAAAIQSFLQSDDFRLAMRRYHEAMFWPNLAQARFGAVTYSVTLFRAEAAWRSSAAERAMQWRGGNGLESSCGDFEQTQFDPNYPGEYRPNPAAVRTVTLASGATVKQEGWRYVSPYWAPGTPIKVCAYDAQESPAAQLPNGGQVPCGTPRGNAAPGCGCGPNLRWCFGPRGLVELPILSSMREQLELAVDEVTSQDKPYTDLLLSTKAYVNGPIAHFKRYLGQNFVASGYIGMADPAEEIPDKPFSDGSFTAIERKPPHAGVVTLPAYLIRFTTDRGRANRWRINFLCEHFAPPAGVTTQHGCSESSNDLTERCYCQHCHQTLEPMAEYWGRFAETGTTVLDEPAFPRKLAQCIGANGAFCRRFYVTQPDAHNPGALLPYQYTDIHPDFSTNLAEGPRALAEEAIADGRFARCTVKRLFAHLVKREMNVAGADADELQLLESLSGGFADSGYRFRWLVEQIVALPQYRRVR